MIQSLISISLVRSTEITHASSSDEIAIELRKLKDSDGNYIWNQNNDTILGKPVYVSSYMNDETKPIIFGDFSYLQLS